MANWIISRVKITPKTNVDGYNKLKNLLKKHRRTDNNLKNMLLLNTKDNIQNNHLTFKDIKICFKKTFIGLVFDTKWAPPVEILSGIYERYDVNIDVLFNDSDILQTYFTHIRWKDSKNVLERELSLDKLDIFYAHMKKYWGYKVAYNMIKNYLFILTEYANNTTGDIDILLDDIKQKGDFLKLIDRNEKIKKLKDGF